MRNSTILNFDEKLQIVFLRVIEDMKHIFALMFASISISYTRITPGHSEPDYQKN